MISTFHLCFRAGEEIPGGPTLKLNLNVANEHVTGHLVFRTGTEKEGGIIFQVTGRLSEIAENGKIRVVISLEGQALNDPKGTIHYHGLLNGSFDKGLSTYKIDLYQQNAQEFKSQATLRTACVTA